MAVPRRKQARHEAVESGPATPEALQALDTLAERVITHNALKQPFRGVEVVAQSDDSITLEKVMDYQRSVLTVSRKDNGHSIRTYGTFTGTYVQLYPLLPTSLLDVHTYSTVPGVASSVQYFGFTETGDPDWNDWRSGELMAPLSANDCVGFARDVIAMLPPDSIARQRIGGMAIRPSRPA